MLIGKHPCAGYIASSAILTVAVQVPRAVVIEALPSVTVGVLLAVMVKVPLPAMVGAPPATAVEVPLVAMVEVPLTVVVEVPLALMVEVTLAATDAIPLAAMMEVLPAVPVQALLAIPATALQYALIRDRLLNRPAAAVLSLTAVALRLFSHAVATSAPKPVVDLVEHFERDRKVFLSPDYKEEQIRAEFLNPFFESLGWDVSNKAGLTEVFKPVIHEESIKVAGATKAPDYTFRIGGHRTFFVEAKKPAVPTANDVSLCTIPGTRRGCPFDGILVPGHYMVDA